MAKAMTKTQLVAKVAEKASITKKAAAEILDFIGEATNKETPVKHNPVGWFEIYVQNLRRAKKFYESVFQVKLTRLNNPKVEIWGFPMEMDGWGAGGALIKMTGVPSGGNSTIVYFSCADCAIEEKRVVRYGGSIEKKKFAIGEYGFISLVFDTEGNMFGLHSLK
ncbi:MAG TPA: VOC family protein [Nitrospirota bacterium]|nr:VOC family protein [Nitrospirota bacterium]